MVKISIITPVYKVQEYLEKCIDSIINQEFNDYELIIVDDGSPDDSGKIADYYSEKYSKIKVIHKLNGGAPSARNAGIDVSKGEYLYFPDSDDWLAPEYLKEMYDCAQKSDAELVISGFTIEQFENGKNRSYVTSTGYKSLVGKESVRKNIHRYLNNMMVAVPWNKLYKADYIKNNNLRFPSLKWDDLHFNLEVLKNINSVAICPAFGYHFLRSREGSETMDVFDGMLYQKRKEQFVHILQIYTYWNVKEKDIWNTIYGYYASRLVQCVQEIAISSAKNKKELVRKILSDDLSKVAFSEGTYDSVIIRIASLPMKYHLYSTSLLLGETMGFVKENMASTFYSIKARSINKAVEKK